MFSHKELERSWDLIEPAVNMNLSKLDISEVEVCATCPLGQYISLKLREHQLFFVMDHEYKNIEIMFHKRPHVSILSDAVVIKALMKTFFYPVHTVASKALKKD